MKTRVENSMRPSEKRVVDRYLRKVVSRSIDYGHGYDIEDFYDIGGVDF